MFEFEFNEPAVSTCSCCGGRTTTLTRFVYRDGDAYAIYYAAFGDKHEPRVVRTLVSIGSWGLESDEIPPDRVAFAMDIYVGPENYEVAVVDASESLWTDAKIVGRQLSRNEALAHPWVTAAFHVTDHMVTDDEPLKAFLDGARAGAGSP